MLRRLSHDRGRRFVNGFFSLVGSVPQGFRIVDFLGHMEPDEALRVRLPSGKTLKSRLVLMPCIDPAGRGAAAFSRFGAGALTFGPVSLGAPQPPAFEQGLEDAHEGSILGTGGAAISVEQACSIRDRTGSSELFFEIDPFTASDPVTAVAKLCGRLAPTAAAIVISPQCFAQVTELGDTVSLFKALVQACGKHDVLPMLGCPLDVDPESAREILEPAVNAGVALYVAGVSSGLESYPWQWGGRGQLDDACALTKALRGIEDAFILVDAGVMSPREADTLRRAGAHLIGIGSGLVHTGPGLPKRINETFLYFDQREGQEPDTDLERGVRRPWTWGMLLGASMLFGALLAGWSALTTVLLPYDEEFLGRTAADIAQFNERVLKFMTHDRITLAGTMVSIGVLYMALSWFAIRRGQGWAQHAVGLSATLGFLSFFAFLGFGYFDPFHAFVTAVLLQFLIQVIVRPVGPRARPKQCPRLDNDAIWRAGLWGQLLFVLHGVALVLAGTTILTFGMTVVFVPQDVAYLGCDAAGIHAFDEQLKSLIAHDRATFGGMLLSAGMALIVTTMWSFRHGDRWLFWTFLLVIFCPYAMTLWIHWDIGYRDHFHLAPVYIGLGLLVMSLVLSARFLLSPSSRTMARAPYR